MKEKFEYFLACFFIRLFKVLPFRAAVEGGALLGRLFYLADRRHRSITQVNLNVALGKERSEGERKRIAVGAFENLGRTVVEFAWIQGKPPAEIMGRTTFEGIEHYEAAIREQKGVVILTAHFGNWEWMGTSISLLGTRMNVVARPLDNPDLNRTVNAWRERYGNRVLNKRTSAAELFRLLRAGEVVGILLDQNTTASEAVFVDYFGRPAATHKGLAILALRTGAAIFPTFIIREGGRHRVVIEKRLDIVRSGDLERDLREATALFTQRIESAVRRHPDHWLWVHRRWKTKPK
ncbi:MAG: lysophospholipid acyltransferase family protein [Candidatus Manganitrophus sp.]|nr:lysophospholipid acyltransferase family protein [Candidatus Manganitrophus sp.]